jgi:hypothetical protein
MRILFYTLLFCSFFWQANAQDTLRVDFSMEGGAVEFDTSLVLSGNCKQCAIYYTLDGNIPTRRSIRYREPIRIIQNTVVRANVYTQGVYSATFTRTFLFDAEHQLPVLCLSTPPDLLFDTKNGLYMLGENAKKEEPNWGANFWSKKEIQTSFEYYVDGKNVLNQITGLKMFGGFSRSLPQKSFSIHARSVYGPSKLKFPFFQDSSVKEFKKVVLRNGGSDWGLAYFRDVLMTDLMKESGLDVQASQPCIVYINGEYWGLYFIREKVGKHFLKDHHPEIKTKQLDLLEKDVWVVEGNRKHYQRMLDYMESNDLSDNKHYQQVSKWMDVDNFVSYMATEIYYDNIDAGGNIKYWRCQNDTCKWRWILYDTDFGFGKHNRKAYALNSLDRHTEIEGPSWPNPPWSTFMLGSLLQNEAFKIMFVNRMADYINTIWKPGYVDERIDYFVNLLDAEMPRHTKRWKRRYTTWQKNVGIVREFGAKRPGYMRGFISDYFKTDSSYTVNFKAKGTKLLINNSIAVDSTWTGVYFQNNPIRVSFMLDQEYQFVQWSHGEKDPVLYFTANADTSIYPLIERKPSGKSANQIIINKVAPKGKEKLGDWLAIYNRSNVSWDLGNWTFYDDKNAFNFPEDCKLDSNQFLYLVKDSSRFKIANPHSRFLQSPFGLNSKSERLLLVDRESLPVDSVRYHITNNKTYWTRYSLSDSTLSWHFSDNADAKELLVFGISENNKVQPIGLKPYLIWVGGMLVLLGLGYLLTKEPPKIWK